MDSRSLVEAWNSLCQTEDIRNEIIEISSISSNSENYTKYIFDGEDSLFSKYVSYLSNSDSEKYEYYKEFYDSDAVVYIKEKDCLLKHPSNGKEITGIYPFNLRLIFEHENSISTAWQEILRFTLLKSEYKLLVTYPNTKDLIDKYLGNFTDVLLSSNYEGHLVIIFCYIDCDNNFIENLAYEWKNKKLNRISLSL